ncbi:MAG: hypothetical protein C0620_00460 [Desulfuromonas sp.]|jgi:hypothetical protein|nr:MAG: hypothetical protein C0620_00460 [Desulfuromonas sp.]
MTNEIHPHMTLLDIVSHNEETISVFQRYDEQAGICLCCMALFETLEHVATTYQLDLNQLLNELRQCL